MLPNAILCLYITIYVNFRSTKPCDRHKMKGTQGAPKNKIWQIPIQCWLECASTHGRMHEGTRTILMYVGGHVLARVTL